MTKIRHSTSKLPVHVIDSASIIGYDRTGVYYTSEKEVRMKRKDSAKFVKENQRKLDSMKRVLNN